MSGVSYDGQRYFAKSDPQRVVHAYQTRTPCPVAVADYDEEGIKRSQIVTAEPGDWIIRHSDSSHQVQCDSSFQLLYAEMLESVK